MHHVSRNQWHVAAAEKLAAADRLFDVGSWSTSYYLYGYVVEFALKAVISRRFAPETIPDPRLLRGVYVHDFSTLLGTALLIDRFREDRGADRTLDRNWDVVLKWSEQARYMSFSEAQADAMRHAVADSPNGVFEWLKTFW